MLKQRRQVDVSKYKKSCSLRIILIQTEIKVVAGEVDRTKTAKRPSFPTDDWKEPWVLGTWLCFCSYECVCVCTCLCTGTCLRESIGGVNNMCVGSIDNFVESFVSFYLCVVSGIELGSLDLLITLTR